MVDDSGSMRQSRNDLKEILCAFVDNLPETTYLTIIIYGSNAVQLFPFRRMNNLQKQGVKKQINSYHDDGSTNTKAAFCFCTKIMKQMPLQLLARNISSLVCIEFTDGDADETVDVKSPCMIEFNSVMEDFRQNRIHSKCGS